MQNKISSLDKILNLLISPDIDFFNLQEILLKSRRLKYKTQGKTN